MRRREFIGLLGGSAAWPLTARAQPAGRVRRLGVLVGLADDDPGMKPRLVALRHGLERLGWVDGRNLRIDLRHAGPGFRGMTLNYQERRIYHWHEELDRRIARAGIAIPENLRVPPLLERYYEN